jgi:hypothetical protein
LFGSRGEAPGETVGCFAQVFRSGASPNEGWCFAAHAFRSGRASWAVRAATSPEALGTARPGLRVHGSNLAGRVEASCPFPWGSGFTSTRGLSCLLCSKATAGAIAPGGSRTGRSARPTRAGAGVAVVPGLRRPRPVRHPLQSQPASVWHLLPLGRHLHLAPLAYPGHAVLSGWLTSTKAGFQVRVSAPIWASRSLAKQVGNKVADEWAGHCI